jgi:predicted NAD-dependent protein-ADP-ribosyltransferase YbiA (DUF1768 family)
MAKEKRSKKSSSKLKFGKDEPTTLDFMTNVYPSLFYAEIDEVPMHFKSVEAYMGYVHGSLNHSANKELLTKIYNAYDGFKAKYFQTKKAGFVPNEDWLKKAKGAKRSLMEETLLNALRMKYTQNGMCAAALVHTGDTKLVYSAPWDELLGSGKEGDGKNRLGKLTMRVRDEIINHKLSATLSVEEYALIVEHGL